MGGYFLNDNRVLSHGEGVVAECLSVPAGDAGQPMGDVLDLDVEGRRVEQGEPSARQHALPGPRRSLSPDLMQLISHPTVPLL